MVHSFYFLFFFLAIEGSIATRGFMQNCNPSRCQDMELRRELEEIGWIPTTAEQLDRLCPPAVDAVKCAVNHIQDCVGRDLIEVSNSNNRSAASFAHSVLSIRSFIIDICTAGSEMQENYLSSISCFKDLMHDPEATIKCQQEGLLVYGTYEESKTLLGNHVSDEEARNERSCMVTAFTLACFATKLHDTCGEVARKMFVDALKRFQFLIRNECTEANSNSLKTEFLEFLQLEERRRSIFTAVFESKRRK